MQAEFSNDIGQTCQTTEMYETSPPCQLTLLPEDSLVSRSARPGSEQAQTMTVTSGRKCFVLCSDAGPLGYVERMCLESTRWHSTRCFLTWKTKATPAGRLTFQLAERVPGTDDTVSGLWRTPVAMLPTPSVACATGGQRSRSGDRKGELLLGGIAAMLPTPRASDWKNNGYQKKGVAWWPTLCGAVGAAKTPHRAGSGGSLNPTWVEWLMGYPLGWTDLGDSETP